MKYYLCSSIIVSCILSACNAGSSSIPNNLTANQPPTLIEAKLTESSVQNLLNIVGTVNYATNYLLDSEGGHSTIAYAPTVQQYNKIAAALTTHLSVVISEFCWSDQFGVEAARATVYNNNSQPVIGTDPYQHVTISYANGKAAVDSNYLFECSSNNYADYPYCLQNNLHITDLQCTQLTSPVTLSANLYESY